MATSETAERMTYAEYVVFEEQADVRHEFIDGDVRAMAGGTPEHAALALAVGAELRAALRGKPCRVYSADARVRVRETNFAGYPDVTVVCGALETDPEDPHAIVNPIVVVEVISESTEAHDRGPKAAHYRRSPSLGAYVLLAQDEPRIEVYRRAESGRWELSEARAGETVEVEAIGAALSVDSIYQDPLSESGALRSQNE